MANRSIGDSALSGNSAKTVFVNNELDASADDVSEENQD